MTLALAGEAPTPQNVDAERALLGGLLQDPVQLVEVSRTLGIDDFYRLEHGALYRLLLSMQSAGIAVDVVTVAGEVMRGGDGKRYGGLGYVSDLPGYAPSVENLGHYAKLVLETSQRRGIIREAGDLIKAVLAAQVDPSISTMQALGRLAEIGFRTQAKRFTWPVLDAHAEWKERAADTEAGIGLAPLSTGFRELDGMLAGHGMSPGQLLVVGGRPGMGKTGFGLAVACAAAEAGRSVLFVSIEQAHREMYLRSMAVMLGMSTEDLLHLDHESRDMLRASKALDTLTIYDKPAPSLREIEMECAKQVALHGSLQLVVIDYLQLIAHDRDRGESAASYVGRTATGCKHLARKFGVPVILLSQLNRQVESRAGGKAGDAWWSKVALPQASDLRDSGQIEADADVILFPINATGCKVEGEPNGGAVVVAKQRNGPTGVVPVYWDGGCATYRGGEG